MATNGVYLTVMLQAEKRAVWRVFRMRDGVRLHDVSVQTFPHELRAWTFDVHRPAHCLLMGNVVGLWDGPFTLPPWMVGFWTGPQGTATTQPNPVLIGQQFSHALADVARMCLGAQKGVPFSIEGDELSSPIEKAIERFAHDGVPLSDVRLFVHPYVPSVKVGQALIVAIGSPRLCHWLTLSIDCEWPNGLSRFGIRPRKGRKAASLSLFACKVVQSPDSNPADVRHRWPADDCC
jgi:hypothetical protein